MTRSDQGAGELEALAARVEALTGPDREVDAEIAVASKAVPYDMEPAFGAGWWRGIYDNRHWQAPEYTASIDAAMTLVPEGWEAAIYSAPVGSDLNANVQIETEQMRQRPDFYPLESIAKSPALALCAAALRAKAASL